MRTATTREQIDRVINSSHHDPFEILGVHPLAPEQGGGVVVRTFQPEADRVLVEESTTGMRFPMNRLADPGFFEVQITDRQMPFSYRLCITHGEQEQTICDPYAFTPVLTDYDLYLLAEGNHHRIYDRLGAHPMEWEGTAGVLFAVWAPVARRVSVVGDFNLWDGRRHPMRLRGATGFWELFIPGLAPGTIYKYEIKSRDDLPLLKSDPVGFQAEMRPQTASVVCELSGFEWTDQDWMEKRKSNAVLESPISIYEVHLGSWMRHGGEENRFLSYGELAESLVGYVQEMGFTHIELLPIMEHPLDESWGYQVSGYFAPTSRHGTPHEFMAFVDHCHANGIGVILDWVPAHFPRDAHGLARFDGSALYEHEDPRLGEHKDWGTLIFNYGRNEVRNFLVSNALFWMDKYHLDGLRIDAVASMLYLDYSRKANEWLPNRFGGRENLEAIEFIRTFNEQLFSYFPGALSIAEESTAWPLVSRPIYVGGLGFNLKWNMGWMHDMLFYMGSDSIYRKYHHGNLTFSLLYAFNENFVLPLSHDEVVHGKGSLLRRMPGDDWQRFANLRLLLAYMYAHPGKKHLFMGGEFGQWNEWYHARGLDWYLLESPLHRGIQQLVRDLNHLLRTEPALYQVDFHHSGFQWIDFHDWEQSVVSFIRRGKDPKDCVVFVFNFTPVVRRHYRIGLPAIGYYREVLNTDSSHYGGSNVGMGGGIWAEDEAAQGWPASMVLDLPPLGALAFKPLDHQGEEENGEPEPAVSP